ncbi:MAG: hypothetical protein ACREJ7_06460 [Candidatus Methylomirabilales bacterium]
MSRLVGQELPPQVLKQPSGRDLRGRFGAGPGGAALLKQWEALVAALRRAG